MARQDREQRAGRGALLGVARDLEPQRREPERAAQRALDDAHRVDAPHRHDRVGALQQPAADAQAVAVARDRETGERDDRADRRERPRDDQQRGESELPAAGRVGQQPRGVLDVALARDHVAEQLGGGGQRRQDHAELARRQRADDQVAAAQPALGQRLGLRRLRSLRAASRPPPRGSARRRRGRRRRARSRPWSRRRPTARAARRRRTGAGPGPPPCRAPGCG